MSLCRIKCLSIIIKLDKTVTSVSTSSVSLTIHGEYSGTSELSDERLETTTLLVEREMFLKTFYFRPFSLQVQGYY